MPVFRKRWSVCFCDGIFPGTPLAVILRVLAEVRCTREAGLGLALIPGRPASAEGHIITYFRENRELLGGAVYLPLETRGQERLFGQILGAGLSGEHQIAPLCRDS